MDFTVLPIHHIYGCHDLDVICARYLHSLDMIIHGLILTHACGHGQLEVMLEQKQLFSVTSGEKTLMSLRSN